MNNYSQFINYAKGMYIQDVDNIDDLKTLVGEYSLIYPEHVAVNDVINHLMDAVSEYMKTPRDFTKFITKISPDNYFLYTDDVQYVYRDHPDYDFYRAVIETCLSTLRCLKIKEQGENGELCTLIELDKPNDDILPLNTSHSCVIELLMENEHE